MTAIDQEIDALEQVHGGLIDPFQAQVLEGTDFFAQLQREGRLTGGPYLWHFEPLDPAARRFADGFRALRADAFGRLALTAYVYETVGTLVIARQLHRLNGAIEGLERTAARLVSAHNALWRDALRSLADWARLDSAPSLG